MGRINPKRARGVPKERFVLLPGLYPQQYPDGTKNAQQLFFKNKKNDKIIFTTMMTKEIKFDPQKNHRFLH